MFTQLAPLAAKATLLIVVAPLNGDRLRLTITPKAADAEKSSSLASFLVEGTPAQLDEGLPAALQGYVEKNVALADALATADGEIAAIQKEKQAQVAAARRPAGKAETKRPEGKTEPPKPAAPPDDTLPLTLETESAAGAAANTTT